MKWKRSRKGQQDSKNKSQGASNKNRIENETRKEPEITHKSQSPSPIQAYDPQFPPSRLFMNPKSINDPSNNPYILGLA